AHLRVALLDGLSAQQFAQDWRGQAARHRLARAELAGAGRPDRQCVRQSARGAGSLLRADDPCLGHAPCRSSFRRDGVDVRRAPLGCLSSPLSETAAAAAGPVFRPGRVRLFAHVVNLLCPYPARDRRPPGARLSAAIEVIADIEARRRPAADALKDWGLVHRFAGSADRAAIAGLVYDTLRRRAPSPPINGDPPPRPAGPRLFRPPAPRPSPPPPP